MAALRLRGRAPQARRISQAVKETISAFCKVGTAGAKRMSFKACMPTAMLKSPTIESREIVQARLNTRRLRARSAVPPPMAASQQPTLWKGMLMFSGTAAMERSPAALIAAPHERAVRRPPVTRSRSESRVARDAPADAAIPMVKKKWHQGHSISRTTVRPNALSIRMQGL